MTTNRKYMIWATLLSLAIVACNNDTTDSSDEGGAEGTTTQLGKTIDPSTFEITDLEGELLDESLRLTVTPNSNPELFYLDEEFSEDFNSGTYGSGWTARSYTFETISFDPSNLSVEDGKLDITIRHNDHIAPYGDSDLHLYFQSGMLGSVNRTTYGYFEARIKGSAVFNGTCPAFWLYNVPWESLDDEDDKYENKVVYNEIDVIELQQVWSDYHILSTNYHMMVLNETEIADEWEKTFVRPAAMWGENESLSEWDSRDDYHIYACENRPDSVIWYIDEQRVASIPNYYWHLPVYVVLSAQIRTPYEKYDTDGNRYAVETTAEEATEAGFPCNMSVDYIRTWRRRDLSGFESAKRAYEPES